MKCFFKNLKLNKCNSLTFLIIGFIIGGLVFGSIGVVAVTLQASQVTYTSNNSDFSASNVKDAIDKLYEISSSESQNVVDLGTGTSFDLTSYDGYENFTTDNFIIVSLESVSKSGSSSFRPEYSANVTSTVTASYSTTKNYNSGTGILTAYATFSGSFSRDGGTEVGDFPSFSTQHEVRIYLVY